MQPLHSIETAARLLDVDYLIVGATARDLLLHAGHGIPSARATVDIDVAIAVATWSEYDTLASQFTHRNGDPRHRRRVNLAVVDLVPFGGVERADRTIAWPPDNAVLMSTIGFKEALDHAVLVKLDDKLVCRVASLPAQLVLKLVAWDERGREKPRHDSVDIRMLLKSYSEGWNLDRLYGDECAALMEHYDYDIELVGAAALGLDVRVMLATDAADHIRDHVVAGLAKSFPLPDDMPGDRAENEALIKALLFGLSTVA